MADLIRLDYYPVQTTLKLLLQDKMTGKNIIWATDFQRYGAADTAYQKECRSVYSRLALQ